MNIYTDCALGIFFRIPEPGKVKRRIAEQLGEDIALRLYRQMLQDTFNNARACRDIKKFGFYIGDLSGFRYPEWLKLHPQRGKGLGEKLLNAFEYLFESGYKRVCIIGSDSPTLPSYYIYDAYEQLKYKEVVVGPAEDGGYYLIGMRAMFRALFSGIAWGTPEVLRQTLDRVETAAVSYTLLPEWFDIDRQEDIKRWLNSIGT